MTPNSVTSILLVTNKNGFSSDEEDVIKRAVQAKFPNKPKMTTGMEDFNLYADTSLRANQMWERWGATVATRQDEVYGGPAYDIMVICISANDMVLGAGNAKLVESWHQRARDEAMKLENLVYYYNQDEGLLYQVTGYNRLGASFLRTMELQLGEGR